MVNELFFNLVIGSAIHIIIVIVVVVIRRRRRGARVIAFRDSKIYYKFSSFLIIIKDTGRERENKLC